MRRATKKPTKTTKNEATPIIETNVEPQQNQQNDWFSKSMARKHLKYCTAALKELKKHPSAGLFLEPVDPVKYGIPDYFDIIKQPMDLGTVESKLNALQYTTVADFESDVRLIFSNCILYNGVDHPVSQQARELESLFNIQLSSFPGGKKEIKPPAAESSTKAAKSVKTTAPAPAATVTPSSSTVNLTIDESRPKRTIKAPAKDLPEAPQPGRRKKTKKNIELNFCRSVLRELKKKTHWPYAYPFYEPVDDEKLGVPDYYKVIKRPMDLATINSKLENDQYANAEEFEEDIRLMFRNCYTYNGVGSEVYNMGKTLESVFNKKWAEKPVPQVKQKGKTKVARDDDTDTDSSSEEEFDEEEVSKPKIKKIQKKLNELSALISNPKKGKSKKIKSDKASTSKGSFNDLMDVDVEKKSLKRPRGGKQRDDDGLSNDQKAFLSSSIELLADTDMNQLIDLLRESGAPLQNDNGSYELEIETLDVKTAKKVFEFVSKRINKQKRRPPPAKKARKHSREDEAQKILALEKTLAKFTSSSDAFNESHYSSEDSSDSQSSDSSGSESEDSGPKRKRKMSQGNSPQATSKTLKQCVSFKILSEHQNGSFKVPNPVQPKSQQSQSTEITQSSEQPIRSIKVMKRDYSQNDTQTSKQSNEQPKNTDGTKSYSRNDTITKEDREMIRKQILRNAPDDARNDNINEDRNVTPRVNPSSEVKGDDLARMMAEELDNLPRSIGTNTRSRSTTKQNTSDSSGSNIKTIQNVRRATTRNIPSKRKESSIPPLSSLEEQKPKKQAETAINKAKPMFYDGGFSTGPIEIKPLPSWCKVKPKDPKPEPPLPIKSGENEQDDARIDEVNELIEKSKIREEENKEAIQHLEHEIMKFMAEKAAKEEAKKLAAKKRQEEEQRKAEEERQKRENEEKRREFLNKCRIEARERRIKELSSRIGWGEESRLMAEMESEPFHLERLAGSIWRRFKEPFDEDQQFLKNSQQAIIWKTVTPFGAIQTPPPRLSEPHLF
ncbi:uncharacterized protein OCT59_006492 [Rhizophagus irregularis]|uniref:Bromodomain-containing protein n=2 Tax=Rhizophagus irregularis TaxID=588596 RepID=A0A915YX49_9GLOM|nr:hypothetical protein OCT59_006492 [Rhizophagus irregularis]GBC20201.2 bromodomain-containing protein [Rhizophagus irregularis DAOM 181602=DAOM 197198]CAB5191479.1 unnamed protein product [Rhizophagus irregularis]CAB5351685.1 unnamed protein product [Rhizophagus irregularis]